tara:strand:- start:1012 stop:1743 length:732 start_codon:yes stop_codon:yes gene_type:complete
MLGIGNSLSSAITTPGKLFRNKYSIEFNGSTQYMTMNDTASDISTANGALSVWTMLGNTSINAVPLKFSVDSNNQVSFMYKNSDQEWWFTYKAGGTGKQTKVGTSAEQDGNWYHLAMTWDTTADEVKCYVNGSEVGDEPLSGLGTWSGTIDKVYSGMNTLADNSYWTGHIDEITIFKETLTDAEISTLYNGGSAKDAEFSAISGLVGYWRFTEGTGTSVADESIYNNSATLVNSPTWRTSPVP